MRQKNVLKISDLGHLPIKTRRYSGRHNVFEAYPDRCASAFSVRVIGEIFSYRLLRHGGMGNLN